MRFCKEKDNFDCSLCLQTYRKYQLDYNCFTECVPSAIRVRYIQSAKTQQLTKAELGKIHFP